MKLTGVELRRISMPLVAPFRTSFGAETTRDILLLRAVVDGPSGESEGWGECVAMSDPLYSSEYVDATVDVLKRFMLPKLFAAGHVDGAAVGPLLEPFKGHWMSKAAIETAVLDAELRAAGRSFARELGATRDRVPCGVSVGITNSIDALLDAVEGYVSAGYVRIKLKIEPGWDVEPVRAVRERFGDDLLIQVDANTAYTLQDARHLARLDTFDLLLIEQPLPEEDVLGHAELAKLDPHADLPRRVDHLGADRRGGDHARRLLDHQHQARPGRRLPGGAAHPRRVRRARHRRSGAAGCWRPASAGPPTSRSPRCPGSRCPATPRRPTGTTRPTSPSRSCCRRRPPGRADRARARGHAAARASSPR